MKSKTADRHKSTWLAAALGLAVLVSLNAAQAQEKNESQEKKAKPAARANQQQRPVRQQPAQDQRVHGPPQDQPHQNPNRAAQQSQTERRRELKPHGAQHQNAKVPESNPSQAVKHPRPQHSPTRTQMGTAPDRKSLPVMKPVPGGAVKKEEVIHKDGSRQVTNHRIGRDGTFRARETIHYGVNQKAVSKTVERTVAINTSGKKAAVQCHYDRGRYGFVYRPIYLVRPRVFISWCDPYWYNPVGHWIQRPFHYSWGWERHPWYHRYHGVYWKTYTVYPTPSYWVTDYVVAAYVADHHAPSSATPGAAQANAAGRSPTATPIDDATKETLRKQIEQTIAEQKELAEQSEKTGKPILPDLSKVLMDPNHIYPVSKTISVVAAKDNSPAGILSEGDLLKVEPGQEDTLKRADENTEVLVRVMASKGEENEVPAGTVIKIFVRDLQEFDSEFRARLDEALVAAESNKDAFKGGLIAPTTK